MKQHKAVWALLGTLAVAVWLAAGAAAEPKLKIDDEAKVWDLTKERSEGIAVGQTAEHEFFLENTGTKPLEILEAKSKNAYLTTVLPKKAIAPGTGAMLKVVFNAAGLEPGRIETHIVVTSNDPASAARPVVLTVTAQVVPRPETLLVVTPQERNIGLVRPGQTETLTYTYENAGSEAFEIYPLYFVDKRFRIVSDIKREVLEPGPAKSFELDFTPRPEDAGSELHALFVVKTGAEEQPRVICRVRGYVAPAEEGVQIVPMYLGEREPRYLFRIKNNTSRAVEVVATRADTTLKSFIVQPKNQTVFDAQVSSEGALSEIAFRVNLDYVPPQPPDTTETEASEPAPNEDEPTDTASQPAEADN